MPEYVFKHPREEKYIEIFFHMNDDKEYVDEKGIEWERVYLPSQLNTDAGIDAWDSNAFVEKTKNQKGTYGDLLDQSAELSEKRASENGGVDPVKQKAYDNYAKKRGGVRHPKELKEKKISSKNVDISF